MGEGQVRLRGPLEEVVVPQHRGGARPLRSAPHAKIVPTKRWAGCARAPAERRGPVPQRKFASRGGGRRSAQKGLKRGPFWPQISPPKAGTRPHSNGRKEPWPPGRRASEGGGQATRAMLAAGRKWRLATSQSPLLYRLEPSLSAREGARGARVRCTVYRASGLGPSKAR
eukprot:scaffold4675_cov378-Prasinococcus_capsulatus_cf.AAC.11